MVSLFEHCLPFKDQAVWGSSWSWKSAQQAKKKKPKQNQNPKPQQIPALNCFGKLRSIFILSKKPPPSFCFVICSGKLTCLCYQLVLSLQFLRSCQHEALKEMAFKCELLSLTDSASCLWIKQNFIWTVQRWSLKTEGGVVLCSGTLQVSSLLMKCLLWVWCHIITFEFAISASLSKPMSCGPNKSDLGAVLQLQSDSCKWSVYWQMH